MTMVTPQELRRQLRALLATPKCYDTASVFDPMSARIAGELGFEVGILGGSVAALQVLAAPDVALINQAEFVEQATRVCRVAELPVIADADHGYGNAINTMRTIVELERAGITAITIEDTWLPPRYGTDGLELIELPEALDKVRAALKARTDPELVIIARTHAGVLDIPSTIERVKAYQDAGADGICMIGVRDCEHLEQISRHCHVPLMLITYGSPHLKDREQLAELGVRVVVNGHGAYFAAIKATYDFMCAQRGVQGLDLNPSQLTTRFSTLDEYRRNIIDFLRFNG